MNLTPENLSSTANPFGEVIDAPAIDTFSPFVWPPGFGWWLLLLALIFAGYFAIIFIKKQRILKRRKLRLVAAINRISDIDQSDSIKYLHELNATMKAIALDQFRYLSLQADQTKVSELYSKSQIAKLSGQSWLAFLDQTGNCNHFTQGVGKVLGDAHYRQTIDDMPDLDLLHKTCADWVKEVC